MRAKLWTTLAGLGLLASTVTEYALDMDFPLTPTLWLVIFGVLVCLVLVPTASTAQTTNSWTASGSGKWEDGGNWDHGAPASSNGANLITNASSKTVTLDSATPAGNRTISNLFIQAPASDLNSLQLNNAGATPVTVLQLLQLTDRAAISVIGSQLVNSNSASQLIVSYSGQAQLTLSNSDILGNQAYVGVLANSTGTITAMDSTLTGHGLSIGAQAGSTGVVLWTRGSLAFTNGPLDVLSVGNFGVGQLTVSNTDVRAASLIIQRFLGSDGTMTMAGGSVQSSNVALSGSLNLSGGSWTVTNFTANGTITVASGTNLIDGAFAAGTVANATGTIWVTGSELDFTNGAPAIGSGNVGSLTVSNGVLRSAGNFIVGASGANTGTLTLAAGTNEFRSQLFIGNQAPGVAWVNNGLLVATNSNTILGNIAHGELIVSNGTVFLGETRINYNSTPSGATLTLAGGKLAFVGSLLVAYSGAAPGALWMTGGELVATNATTFIGNFGKGQMTISNGMWTATDVRLAVAPFPLSSAGTLTVVGGTHSVYTGMTLGPAAFCQSTGTVIVAGGRLSVTNAAGTATLEVDSGTVHLDAGTLTVDRLVMTNACGHILWNGGVLNYNVAILDPTLDQDGDGIPTGWEQDHGLNPLYAADAALDNDHDGYSNLQEYLAGTDPNNSASFFAITAITKESNDIRVTWETGLGNTNALERATGDASGSYSDNFTTIFTVTNATTLSTNHLDVGASTNTPSLYYRARLVP